MRNGKSKLAVSLALAIVVVIVCPLVIILMNRPNVPSITLPEPNAYDTLTQAGTAVRLIPADYAETEDLGKLRSLVAANAAALTRADKAMDQECLVPINYEAGTQGVIDSTYNVRQAMQLLHAAGRLAELEHDASEAATRYSQLFLLANKSAVGGVTVHVMSALPYQRIAIEKLQELSGRLAPDTKNRLLTMLESANRQPVIIAGIVEREQVLFKKEHGTLMGTYWLWMANRRPNIAIQRLTQADLEIATAYQELVELLEK